jgi:succinoglycan biosynthesis protein ExoO
MKHQPRVAGSGSPPAPAPLVPAPLVSVVVPARNAGATIDSALASVLDGQEVPLEVIVVDDASTDDTAERVREAGRGDTRVRLLTGAGEGAGAARNRAIAAASGTWIAPLDADDRFRPGRLARLTALGESENADLVGDDLNLVGPGRGVGPANGTAFGQGGPAHLSVVGIVDFVENNMFHADAMGWGYMKPLVRRSVLEACGIRYDPGLRIAEDYQLYFELLRAGARFLYTAEALYDYTLAPGSLSHAMRRSDAEAILGKAKADLASAREAGGTPLIDALERRCRGIESMVLYDGFVSALKRFDLISAAGLTLRSPALWPLIVRYGRESVVKRLPRDVRA